MNKVQGIKCSSCDDEVWSRSVHDMRYCKCGKSYVDGGPFYLHYGWEPEIDRPTVVEIETNEKQSKKDSFPY